MIADLVILKLRNSFRNSFIDVRAIIGKNFCFILDFYLGT